MAGGRMHLWGARSSPALFMPRSRRCSSCPRYFRLFMGEARYIRFPLRRLSMADKKIRRYALVALIVAVALGIWGEVSRVLARAALGKETAESAIPTVVTVTAERSTLGEDLVLHGAGQAYIKAPIFAP